MRASFSTVVLCTLLLTLSTLYVCVRAQDGNCGVVVLESGTYDLTRLSNPWGNNPWGWGGHETYPPGRGYNYRWNFCADVTEGPYTAAAIQYTYTQDAYSYFYNIGYNPPQITSTEEGVVVFTLLGDYDWCGYRTTTINVTCDNSTYGYIDAVGETATCQYDIAIRSLYACPISTPTTTTTQSPYTTTTTQSPYTTTTTTQSPYTTTTSTEYPTSSTPPTYYPPTTPTNGQNCCLYTNKNNKFKSICTSSNVCPVIDELQSAGSYVVDNCKNCRIPSLD